MVGGHEAFHGVILKVAEPVEPSEVLWHHFDVRNWYRNLRVLLSTLLSAGILVISYYLLLLARHQNAAVSAIITSTINVALPLIMKLIVSNIEIHIDKSDIQDSIMLKLVISRCFNVAIMKYIVTDYVDTFSVTSLKAVVSILIADTFTNPLLSVLNINGRFQQFFLAPRAKTQRQMNLYFLGSGWNLAERYTDMVKTAFLCLFWSSILPVSCFLASMSFVMVYLADKYNLLYQWKRPPLLDDTLAARARNFLSISICSHVIMTRIFYAVSVLSYIM